MSQILLPPPAHSQPEPATTAVALPRRTYEPEPPNKPSAFWRAVKWPLRQLFKAIYLTGAAANRHRVVAAIVLVVLLLLGGGTYAVYHVTHPNTPAHQPGHVIVPYGGKVPFTLNTAAAPPLPPAVITFLQGNQSFKAQEVMSTLSPQIQQSVSASDLQAQLDSFRNQGLVFEQFIYSGGYSYPDGTSSYTIQVVIGQKGHTGFQIRTWYVVVDGAGQIINQQDLTPPTQQPQQ
jgi:hypothetical protein